MSLHWRTERLDQSTLIICRLPSPIDDFPLELAHAIKDVDLHHYHDPKWLVRNAIAVLTRTARKMIQHRQTQLEVVEVPVSETIRCPYCGNPAYEDEVEPPVDYCHHDAVPA